MAMGAAEKNVVHLGVTEDTCLWQPNLLKRPCSAFALIKLWNRASTDQNQMLCRTWHGLELCSRYWVVLYWISGT